MLAMKTLCDYHQICCPSHKGLLQRSQERKMQWCTMNGMCERNRLGSTILSRWFNFCQYVTCPITVPCEASSLYSWFAATWKRKPTIKIKNPSVALIVKKHPLWLNKNWVNGLLQRILALLDSFTNVEIKKAKGIMLSPKSHKRRKYVPKLFSKKMSNWTMAPVAIISSTVKVVKNKWVINQVTQ